MKVLVACEESQVVCNAFRAKGHEAYSCDILPTRGAHPEWHIRDDVLNHLDEGWDLMIGHPDCRFIANSGVRWLCSEEYLAPVGIVNNPRFAKMMSAVEFFLKLWDANIPRICLENPIPHKWAKICGGLPQYDQIIQPWQFGHGETKATCLWLKNLPKLEPTNIVDGRENRVHRMAPGPNRSRDRAVTFQGIAEAMADRWGRI